MTTIKIDIDDRRYPARVFRRIEWVARLMRLTPVNSYIMRSRHGWHIAIQVRERLAPAVVVAIQAIVGSDWRREAYCLMRTRRLRGRPELRDAFNVLYHARGA